MAYGVRYRGRWQSPMRGKRSYVIEIAEEGYTGTSVAPLLFAGDVLTLTYGERDDSELKPIKSSECELTILCTEEGNPYTALYTLDPWKYKLSISEDVNDSLNMVWQGYLSTGDYSQPIAKAPYSLRIRANDGLGLLKTIDYLQDGERFNDTLNIRELLTRLLNPISPTMLPTLWPANKVHGIQNGETFDIIGIADSSIYASFGESMPTYYDVLEALLESFGLQLFQDAGGWCARSVDRLASAVRSSLITPIDMAVKTDGLGMSSSGTLRILPPVNNISSQYSNESSIALNTLLNRRAWQYNGIGGKYYPRIVNYTNDSLKMSFAAIGYEGMAMSAVNILPNIVHTSATTEIDISIDLYNALSTDTNVIVGVWLVDASIANNQLITTEVRNNAAYTILSAPCYGWTGSDWIRVPSNTVLSPTALGLSNIKLNKGKVNGGRPSLSTLEKQSVNITIPHIPQILNNDYYIRDWKIAIIFARAYSTTTMFYMASPKVTVRATRESNIADSVTIAGEGIDKMTTSTKWGTVADSATITSLGPQLINVANGSMLYGYLTPSNSNTSIANKGTMVNGLRADTTMELEGIVDKRNSASLNNVWQIDGKYYYAPYLRYKMRSDLVDVQLRELYHLNIDGQGTLIKIGTNPVTNPIDVGRSLYHISNNKLYVLDSITATNTLLEDLSNYVHYMWKGVDCLVSVKVVNKIPIAIAYGEGGKILAELTWDSNTISADAWGKTIVYDARNQQWLATNKAGKITIYDQSGFVVETYDIATNISGGNIRAYSDGFVYVSELSNGDITADWHSYSIHSPGETEPLSGLIQNIVEINDSIVMAYNDEYGEYVAYVRRGVDLRENDIIRFRSGQAFITMNNAIILLRSSDGNNIVYDLRSGGYISVTAATSKYATISNDSLCTFGSGIVANNYRREIIIPTINDIG